VILPLSFNNGGPTCPEGYSTFSVQTTDNTGQQASCVFPFKVNGTLYYDCVTRLKNRQNPWCATTFDYDLEKRWGYCVDVKCYKIVEESKKRTYNDARDFCQSEGSYLASINSEIDQGKYSE
jgi:hypothetical protein